MITALNVPAPQTGAPVYFGGRFSSPIGEMVAVVDSAGALTYLDFEDHNGPVEGPATSVGDGRWRDLPFVWDYGHVRDVEAQVMEYFAGTRRVFDLALSPIGNEFYLGVWNELRRIPYGVTISYGELARRVGRPGAARAVGRANGTNPISIVVPCHRVIGADGKLTGYSGGIERKAALLALEQAATPAGQGTLPLRVAPGRIRKVR